MPLILSAINFKLSPTEKAMNSRRYPLECLGDLISNSSRVYEVTDFVSTKADDILHLAYITSQDVFLREDPNISPQKSIGPSTGMPNQNLHPQHSKADAQLIPGRVKSWHDAFLRHTRAYLLISTTVDYFMSVGRLPQNNSLPELVCFMPPFGKIQLPWSLGQHRLACQMDPELCLSPGKESQIQNGCKGFPNIKEVKKKQSIRTVSNHVAHEGLAQKVNLADHDDRAQHGQLNEINVDYLPFSQPPTGSPLPGISDPIASLYSPAFDSTLITDMTMDQADLWELTEDSTSYNSYFSGLVYECLGSAPTVDT